jgi:phosphatidate phosphatase LPIN
VSQQKVKFDSGHQSGLLEEHGEVTNEKDESHHISVDAGESFCVSDNEVGVFHVSANENEAYAVSPNEDEALDVSRSGNSNERAQTQTLCSGVSGNNDTGYQPLTSEDGSRGVSGNNDPGYQPLTGEDESTVVSGDNTGYQPLTNDHESNDEDHQPLLTNEDESCDTSVPDQANDCRSPANLDEGCDLNNEDIGLEDVGSSLRKYDTFKSCLDLTSQIDDADSGNGLFSPESDSQRDSELGFSNRSVVGTDLEEDESKTVYSDQDVSLHGADIPTFTSEDNVTSSKGSSSHHVKESNLSPEVSHDKSKNIASAKAEAGNTDGLQSSMGCSDKDKLGSIPEHSEGEEELGREEKSQLQKGLGKHMPDLHFILIS